MEKLSLSDYRRRNGLTQQELADRLGVSRNYVALIENGRKPFTEKLRAKLSLVNSQEPETAPSPAETQTCQYCAEATLRIAELEKERDYLRRQVEALIGKLPDGKPSALAAHACGAADGNHKDRRGA